MEKQPNTQYLLSLSYGKDSLACLEAIKRLGYPLDRIVHAEVWATDTIPADLPPMVEFKAHADKIIKERYGIEVEHICAMKNGEKVTYEKMFYHEPKRREQNKQFSVSLKSEEYGATVRSKHLPFKGFPLTRGSWCKKLKTEEAIWKHLRIPNIIQGNERKLVYGSQVFSDKHLSRGADINTVTYLGIALDEPIRIERHRHNRILPLVDIGWTEADCRKWCEENDLL